MDERDGRLNEPHVKPLMDLVSRLRSRWDSGVPNVDPNDGGVNAKVLFLSETPGPKAVKSGYVSRDNGDPSAQHAGEALDSAGFPRSDYVRWNVVPYYVSTEDKNANATPRQIHAAADATQAFIGLLRNLRVVVFCGLQAHKAIPDLVLPPGVQTLATYHCGAMSWNQARCRKHILETFKRARELAT